MKAAENSLAKLLQTECQFTIPIYQRTYSWTLAQCNQLLQDIIETEKRARSSHFLGAIVYIKDDSPSAKLAHHVVIDGQQRLTTLSLLLIALRDHLGGAQPSAQLSKDQINFSFLVNQFRQGADRYKLTLTETDSQTLHGLVDSTPRPAASSDRINDNYAFFRDQLRRGAVSPDDVANGIWKLTIVEVTLDARDDDPQLIFESLNSTGLALSQADLIRNFVLMRGNRQTQETLYTQYWRVMEELFGQQNYSEHFDAFMRHFLTVKLGRIPTIRRVYDEFKTYVRSDGDTVDIEDIVKDIYTQATYYTRIALNREPDAELKRRFDDLMALEVNVAIPFILELYADYEAGTLKHAEFARILGYIEAYVIRRSFSDLTANSLNKTFQVFSRFIDKGHYLDSVSSRFAGLAGTLRYPNDDEFRRAFATKDVYNLTRRRNYVLGKLTNAGSREPVDVDALTIEHIMPHAIESSPSWQRALGPEWQRIHTTYLHTIGNLTLTGYNAHLSNKTFPEKRDMPRGFRDSQISLNKSLQDLNIWDEASIKKRGRQLADRAAGIWPYPDVTASMSAKTGLAAAEQEHALIDHHFPDHSTVQPLWEELRKRILNLDPIVTEELFKSYIAYKASTNFVDVSPKLAKLVLTLNVPFHYLTDDQHQCKDVSLTGKMGNGDAQFELSQPDQMDYAMGLIRQAFWHQESADLDPVIR